jgi:hypothetical protein
VAWEPPIWNGPPSSGPSILIVPSPVTYVQPGTSTLTFTFHQAYDDANGQPDEQILINLEPLACNYTIQATYTK